MDKNWKIGEKTVDRLYHCGICQSKMLESRIKKHHAKVHPDFTFDIYTPLMSVASEMSPKKSDAKAADIDSSAINGLWGIGSPNDESQIHVQCGVCRNKMRAADLDAHMKRKHAEPIDQVDAIGTMVDMIDAMGIQLPVGGFAKQVMPGQQLANNSEHDLPSSAAKTTPNKDSIDFGRDSRAASTSTTNIKPSVDVDRSNEEVYYTIRINEVQMQELFNNNRIYPKNGAFYLK